MEDTFFKKIARRILLVTFVLPLLLVMKLIAVFYPYQFVLLGSRRIGHLAVESELLLRRQYKKSRGTPSYIYVENPRVQISNVYLYQLVKKHFSIIRSYYFFNFIQKYRYHSLIKLFNLFFIFPDCYDSLVEFAEEGYAPVQLQIPKSDIASGREIVRDKFEVDVETDKIICIFARDSQYLSETFPGVNYSHHDYRDVDIQTFIKTIDYLTNKGYKVFRMGKIMKNPVEYQHPNFFDYAFSEHRSDFLDVFLFHQCYLTIGTTCGLVDLTTIFNRPNLIIGFAPPFDAPTGYNALHIPKKVCYSDTQEEISIDKLYDIFLDLEKKYQFTYFDMKRFNFSYVENTSEEIFLATVEMLTRLEGRWHSTQEDQSLEACYLRYWERVRRDAFLKPSIATSFLKINKHLFN